MIKNLKLCIFVLFFLLGSLANAQKRKPQNDPGYEYKAIHFGFTIGANFMDFGFHRSDLELSGLYPEVPNYIPGFQVGIISDARLGDYFSLRILPTVSFGSRKLTYFNTLGDINFQNDFFNPTSADDPDRILDQWSIESTYIEFPVLLKYKSKRVNNYMPYVIMGLNVKFDMAAEIGKNEEGLYPPRIILRPFDYCYEIGIGIDWFLPYFKLGTELKFSIGLRDVMTPNPAFILGDDEPDPEKYTRPYTEVLNKLTSNVFMLSFHFE